MMNIDLIRKELNRIENKRPAFKEILDKHRKIIILGNGGSNAIASHITQDYTKQLGKEAFTFSDPSRLTCYINDYGIENANVQFLKEFSDQDTLIIIISSSGNSINMVKSLEWCIEQKRPTVILTGFSKDNKMNTIAAKDTVLLKYWVESSDYGVVECSHELFLHSVLGGQ